jgi:hypothetical protein
MNKRLARVWATTIGATLAILLAGSLSVAYAGVTPVDTGTWEATTTVTHTTFKFKIAKHGPSTSCGTTDSARCLYAITYPNIPDPCPNGEVGGGAFDIPNGFVNTHGVLSYTYGSPTKADYIQFKITLSGGKGSGTMRNNSPVELGNEGPPVCESGIVKFTARHL